MKKLYPLPLEPGEVVAILRYDRTGLRIEHMLIGGVKSGVDPNDDPTMQAAGDLAQRLSDLVDEFSP
jgi:hypothetical protein